MVMWQIQCRVETWLLQITKRSGIYYIACQILLVLMTPVQHLMGITVSPA